MEDLITELESKVKNCHNTNTIFDTRNYVLLDDVRKIISAINYTSCCKSDSEQLVCVVGYLSNFTKGKKYECKPDGKKHFEVYDDFGDWYSVHKKCFNKTELAS